jgi:hypothetical protein
MNLETIDTLIAATIPLLILYIGYRIDRRLKSDQEAKQKEQDTIERKHNARIQFELDGKVFGPQKGIFIAELTVILHNKGLIRNFVNDLHLNVRGIENDSNIELFKEKDQKGNIDSLIKFPIKIIDTDMLQKRNEKDGFFVEPGVLQKFTYVASIPDNIRFILVRSNFKYHEKSKHSVQKVFELQKETGHYE